jgi:hypothetical protein
MKFGFLFLLFLVLTANSGSEEINDSRKYVFINTGFSFPVYGDFADSDSGFKKAFGFSGGYVKDIDDTISFGFYISSRRYYENRKIDMKIRIFSFTPVVFSWIGLSKREKYLYFGPGIYHWSQPKSASFSSSSSTEGGFRVGLGFKKKLYKSLDWGANLEWNHMFNMSGKNLDIGSSNMLNLSFSIIKLY